MEHVAHVTSSEIQCVQAISVRSASQWNSCGMMRNQQCDRMVDGSTQHTSGTHVENVARTRVQSNTKLWLDHASLSWAFVPKQVVGITPCATDGASTALPWGTVVSGGGGKPSANQAPQWAKGNHCSNRRRNTATLAHHPGSRSVGAAEAAAAYELRRPGHGQGWRPLQRRRSECGIRTS